MNLLPSEYKSHLLFMMFRLVFVHGHLFSMLIFPQEMELMSKISSLCQVNGNCASHFQISIHFSMQKYIPHDVGQKVLGCTSRYLPSIKWFTLYNAVGLQISN
jgi:hypothetical protein